MGEARRASSGRRDSWTAPCAPSRNITRGWNTFTSSGQGRVGAPPARLAMVEPQRIFRRDRGGTKAALRFDHRPSKDALQSQNADLIQSTGDVQACPTQKLRTARAAVRATRFSRHLGKWDRPCPTNWLEIRRARSVPDAIGQAFHREAHRRRGDPPAALIPSIYWSRHIYDDGHCFPRTFCRLDILYAA